MDHPSQIFSRIRRQKARPALPRQGQGNPAPAPIHAPGQTSARVDIQSPAPDSAPPQPAASIPPAPPARPARGHALYSQVMRNHDRMGTRHL